MRLALLRKGNVKLVARREEVVSLIGEISSADLSDAAAAAVTFRGWEAKADELGLAIAGECWSSRLEIKKKGGGGLHFSEEERALATTAHRRAISLHGGVTLREQLRGRAAAIGSSVNSFRAGAGVSLGKRDVIARLHELLNRLRTTLAELFDEGGGGALRAQIKEMEALGVPESVSEDAAHARKSALELANLAHELAVKELNGLRSEQNLTRKFRAPQTLAVVHAAEALCVEAAALAAPAGAQLDQRVFDELREGVKEVEPLVAAAEAGDQEEEEDAV